MSLNQITQSRALAITGILAGLGVLGEFIFFGASGFPGTGFNDPSVALPYLDSGGTMLRIAVMLGAINVGLWTVFAVPLAAVLFSRTPALAIASLVLTIVGNVGDGLVALSFYRSVAFFPPLASSDAASARAAWDAFAIVTSGFQSVGSFFLGGSLLVVGWAILRQGALPRALGAVGLLAGALAIANVLGIDAAYFGALLLVIVFRIWAGLAVLQAREAAATPNMQPVVASRNA